MLLYIDIGIDDKAGREDCTDRGQGLGPSARLRISKEGRDTLSCNECIRRTAAKHTLQQRLPNTTMADAGKKHIAFFHPDLGIGGAERLIVDAAVGLQNRGHKVVIFTSYCDSKHCFDEARDGN